MFRLATFCLLFALATAQKRAIVVLPITDGISGTITFTQTDNGVLISGQVVGLPVGDHGFHIHALGDLSNGCTSTGSHFNPYNNTHGAPNDTVRHVGDLGNIRANTDGTAVLNFTDNVITLEGRNSIIGRAVVIHSDVDDFGKGGHDDSLSTGHAGSRLVCGVIGILYPEDFNNSAFSVIGTNMALLLLMIFSACVIH